MNEQDKQTHFGFQTVNESEKANKVAQVLQKIMTS